MNVKNQNSSVFQSDKKNYHHLRNQIKIDLRSNQNNLKSRWDSSSEKNPGKIGTEVGSKHLQHKSQERTNVLKTMSLNEEQISVTLGGHAYKFEKEKSNQHWEMDRYSTEVLTL